ncbi:MAG TPA: RecQ family ATP-dependent DNA helicase [Miltoncostaeaceae bacterium]|nr:RecQ family ATP-dependent DNA helicase [Miltoncostaeaceae bacterium]
MPTDTDHTLRLDASLPALGDLARWIAHARRAGGETPQAHAAIEAALRDLRTHWRDLGAEDRRELAAAVTALIADRSTRPPDHQPARPPGAPLDDLLERFGVRRLRPGQDRAIAAALGGRDALVIMATGSGKSLCYQVPAAMLGGLTVVVSPLIALMRDQIAGLDAAGVDAVALNSTLDEEAQRAVLERMRAGDHRLVYVAPERFNSPSFRRLLTEVEVDLLVIDEAHCVSEWGHEFRPDYRRVGALRAQIRPRATIALTATATARVQRDIVARVGLDDPLIVTGGFDRPNIAFDAAWIEGKGAVARRQAILDQLLRTAADGKAIIYCGTRRATDETAERLRAAGHSAVAYHAGRDDRAAAQEAFSRGTARIVTATNAFGMGVNVPDVRLVVHLTLPDSLEQLYQEAGRAGRDGEAARHVILAGPADAANARRRLDAARIGVGEVGALLGRLAAIADEDGHFLLDRRECDDRATVHLALAERIGALELHGAPGGGRAGRLREWRLDGPRRQLLAGLVSEEISRRHAGLQSAIAYVHEDACRRRMLLAHFDDSAEPDAEERCCDHCQPPGDLSAALVRGAQHLAVASPARAAGPSGPEGLAVDERARFDVLRRWRAETAKELGWPAFRISPNRALAAIAVADPRDEGALGSVHGVGPWLVETYGEVLLELLREHRGRE